MSRVKRLDLSIGQRLGIGFSLILLLLGSLIGLMYYWNAQSARAQDAFTQRIAPLSSAAEDLQGSVQQVAISIRALMIRTDSAPLA